MAFELTTGRGPVLQVEYADDTIAIALDMGYYPFSMNEPEEALKRLAAQLDGGIRSRRTYVRDINGDYHQLVDTPRGPIVQRCSSNQREFLSSLWIYR